MTMKRDARRAGANVKSAAAETKHRVKAEVEHGKRNFAGDSMTATQKLKSVTKEAKEKTAAGLDRAERKSRPLKK